MEELVVNGLTKSIGVSNFNKRQIEDIIDIATVMPVNNQVLTYQYAYSYQIVFNQVNLWHIRIKAQEFLSAI